MSEPRIAAREPIAVELEKGEEYYWCKCGRSKNQPFCDGSHAGTDFTPLLAEAQRHGPDMAVFLTDLDGRVDYCPPFPVLWAVPASAEQMQAPFGRKLVLE